MAACRNEYEWRFPHVLIFACLILACFLVSIVFLFVLSFTLFCRFQFQLFYSFHGFLVSIVLSFPWFSRFHCFLVSHGFLVSIVFRFHWFSLQHIFKTNSIFVLHVYMAQSAQDAEIAVDAAQCCGTSTRAVNGQVRQCNSMCLLRCSCEHAEMRRYVVVRQQRTKGIGSRDTSMHPSAEPNK